MIGLSFFKKNKPRQYNYIPRYYDPQKDAREERKRQLFGYEAVEQSANTKEYVPGSYIRNARMHRITAKPEPDQAKKTFLVRFIIFMVMLSLVAYIIIKSPLIDLFVEGLTTK